MVFVTNTQDLAALNRWETESAQPTRRPLSHAWYKALRATHLQRRIAFPFLFPPWADEADRTWEQSVRDLLARYRGRLVWLFYPLRDEAERGLVPCRELRPLIDDRAERFEIGALPGWSAGCYQDEVHPSAKGRALLLEALTAALAQARR
jgi:lysophospholipase L1-like esterase